MAARAPDEYQFGPYTYDPLGETLRKSGKNLLARLPLIRLLRVLLRKHGRTVSRDVLKRTVWNSADASNVSLDVLVCQLRELLRDDRKNPRFIRTYPSEGYRFIYPIKTLRAAGDKTARSKAIATCETARYRWSLRTPASIRESIQLYKRAIAEDPNYPLALSGRADAWIMAGIHCLMPPSEAFRRARSDAADALRIAPDLPEAIVSEAWVKLCFDRDLTGAKRGFARALRLTPQYPFAHNGLALLHLARRNPQRAVKAMEKAWTAKATSPFLNALLADAFYHARNYKKAAERGRLAVQSDPDFAVGHACIGKIYLQQKNFAKAVEHLESVADLSGGSPVMLGFLAYTYASAGKKSKAHEILKKLLKKREGTDEYVPAFFVALAHLGLGDRKRTLAETKQAIRERSHWVLFLKSEPMFDPLRKTKCFQAWLKSI